MPQIPQFVAGTKGGDQSRFSPRQDTSGAAAVSRSLDALGSSIKGFGRGISAVGAIVDNDQKIREANRENEEKIRKAKEDQEARERIAKAQVALKESLFEAEVLVPSEAETVPGSPGDAQATKPTLMEIFEELSTKRIDALKAPLRGEALEQFEMSNGLDMRLARLRVKAKQRARDIDASRASLSRTEAMLLERADDPSEDVDALVVQFQSDVGLAMDNGVYPRNTGQGIINTFKKDATQRNDRASHLSMVQSASDEIMSLELSDSDGLKMARSVQDAKVRKDVVRAVEHRQKQKSNLLRDVNEDSFDQMALAVETQGVTPEEAGVDSLPVDLQRELHRIHRGTLRKVSSSKADNLKKTQRWSELWDMANDDPEKFKDLNLRAERTSLPNATSYNELVSEQKKMRGGKEVTIKSIDNGAFGARPIVEQMYPDNEALQKWAMFRINEIATARGATREKPLTVAEQRGLAIEVNREADEEFNLSFPFLSFSGFDPVSLLDITPERAKEIAETPIADQDERWIKLATDSLLEIPNMTKEQISPDLLEETIADFLVSGGFTTPSALERPE